MSSLNKIGFCLLVFIAALSAAHFCWASYNTLRIGFADINVFLYSVLNYLHTGFLYRDDEPLAMTYEAGRSVLKFPPLYVVPYMPWLHFDPVFQKGINPNIYGTLFAIHVLRYVIAFFLIGFFLGPRKNPLWWLLLVIVFALCAPFYEALYGLTFDNLYLFILVCALVLMRYRQQFTMALVLMFAANVKLYPFFQGLQFLAARNWTMVFFCAIATLMWLVLSLCYFDLGQHTFYYLKVVPVLLQEDVLCETGNLSLAALFCHNAFPLPVFRLGLLLCSFLVCVAAYRKKNFSLERDALVFSLLVCLPLLIMKNVWGNYQLVLLVPITVLLAYALNKKSIVGKLIAVLALLAWLPLIVSDNYPAMNIPYYDWINARLLRFMIDDAKPFSVLLLWSTLAGLLLFDKKLLR